MSLWVDIVVWVILFVATMICFYVGLLFSPNPQTGTFYIALSIWFLLALQWQKNSIDKKIGVKK